MHVRVCSYVFIMQVRSNVDSTRETNWKLIASPWQLGPTFSFPHPLSTSVWVAVGLIWVAATERASHLSHTHINTHTETYNSQYTHIFPYTWNSCNSYFILAAFPLQNPSIHPHCKSLQLSHLLYYCHSDPSLHTHTHTYEAIKNTYIIISIHPLSSPQTSDRLAKNSPSCCLGNPEEYSSVAMTTGDAHPVWSVEFLFRHLAGGRDACVGICVFSVCVCECM